MPGLETAILTGPSGERMMALNTIGDICGGKGRLRIGEEERVVGPGDLYYIPWESLTGIPAWGTTSS